MDPSLPNDWTYLQKQFYLECLLTSGLIYKAQLTEELWDMLADERLPEAVVITALSLMMTRRRRILYPDKDLRKLVVEVLHDQKAVQDLSRWKSSLVRLSLGN